MFADQHKVEDLAYAAGFFEADGCVTITGKRIGKLGYPTYAASVIVGQKTPFVPEWFAATFGGKVKIQRPSLSSKSGHRFPTMYVWSRHCQKAADFLELVIPYLKMKKYRAELCVQLARMSTRRGGSGWRYHGKEVTLEEYQQREKIAVLIRQENMLTSARCSPIERKVPYVC